MWMYQMKKKTLLTLVCKTTKTNQSFSHVEGLNITIIADHFDTTFYQNHYTFQKQSKKNCCGTVFITKGDRDF